VVNETLIDQLIGSTVSHLFQFNSFYSTSPNRSATSDNYEIQKKHVHLANHSTTFQPQFYCDK